MKSGNVAPLKTIRFCIYDYQEYSTAIIIKGINIIFSEHIPIIDSLHEYIVKKGTKQ